MIKHLLISITASTSTGNPYRDIECNDWHCKAIFYAYFDDRGSQIGRAKHIQISKGQRIPNDLINDIMNPEIVKMSWDACKTRVFSTKIIGYPLHQYLDPYNWIDLQTILKINGYPADSIVHTARQLKIYPKSYKESSKFSLLVQIIKVITKDRLVNLNQLAGFLTEQIICDKGIVINLKCLEVGMKLLSQYKKAIQDFADYYDYPISERNIRNDLFEKYGLSPQDSLDTIFDYSSTLSQLELGLVHIHKFITSLVIKAFEKVSNTICCDGRLRGAIHYWDDPITGRIGGVSIFEKYCQFTTIPISDYIAALDNIDDIDISQSETVIESIKRLIPLLLVSEKEKMVLDFSKVTEYIICKFSNCEWRKRAFIKDTLSDILMLHCNLTPFSDRQILQIDLQLALGNGSYCLDRTTIKKWRSLNRDIIFTHGLLAAMANKTIHRKVQSSFNGVIFGYDDNNLSILLPTGRVILFEISSEKNITLNSTKKTLTGGYLFKSICLSMQRDIITFILNRLINDGYNVAYHTNNQIVLEDDRILPSYISSSEYIRISKSLCDNAACPDVE